MNEKMAKNLNIEACFLGTFEITVNCCLVSNLGTQKNRALAAYLLLESPKQHSRSEVAALFWPDAPEETALHNLRQALSGLRKAFDPFGEGDVFSASRDQIGFQENARVSTDVGAFETGIGSILDHVHHQGGGGFPLSRFKRVLSLYKGELLSTTNLADADLFSDWLVLKREALHRLAVEGNSLLLRYFENRKEWREASRAAEHLVKLAPWDEDAHRRLIDALLQLAQGNAALAQFQSAERYLKVELGVEPGSQLKKAQKDIEQFFNSGRISARQEPNRFLLPLYSTSFVGRGQELETLEDWVCDPNCRVITITGPGGSGKTRLAARLAENQRTAFSGGVFFISMAGCTDRDTILSKILEAVSSQGVHSADPMQEILDWAGNRCALVILDNVEDCTEVAQIAAELLESSAFLTLVFTAYNRLDLIGERVYALKGLSTNGGSTSEAVALFLSHLQSESHPESAASEFLDNVVGICSIVEGLPLAIDLAAGQVKRLSSSELLAELTANMDILRSQAVNLPERHRSITASFDNCWNHLTPRQRKMLSILTIFDSPFTFDAAVGVCGIHPEDVRDLASQSLLVWDAGETYRFHRAVRQYARDKRAFDVPEMKQLEERHAHYFCETLLEDHKSYAREGILNFLNNFRRASEDIEKSMQTLISVGDWPRVQQMINPIFCYYEARSLFRHGSTLLQNLAALCPAEEPGQRCKYRLQARAARLLINFQEFAAAQVMLEQSFAEARAECDRSEESFCLNALASLAAVKKSSSLSLDYAEKALLAAREAGDHSEKAHSLYNQGHALINLGEITRAEKVLVDCQAACETLGDWRRLAKTLNLLADTECNRGKFDKALEHYQEASILVEKMENRYSHSLILNNMGTAYFSTKRYSQAEEAYRKSLEICHEIDDREGEAIALSNLGELFADQRDFRKGAEHNRQALEICLEIGSEWGEMSARVVFAWCLRELANLPAAVEQVLVVLNRTLQLEYIYFFNRGVEEACWLLMERNRRQSLRQIISFIVEDDESDDWIRSRAEELLEALPPGSEQKTGKPTREWIRDFLVNGLREEFPNF